METEHFEDPKVYTTGEQSPSGQWREEEWDHKVLPGSQKAGVKGL